MTSATSGRPLPRCDVRGLLVVRLLCREQFVPRIVDLIRVWTLPLVLIISPLAVNNIRIRPMFVSRCMVPLIPCV